MAEWMPIETAPKDGTVVDCWVGGEFPTRYENCYFGTPHHECLSEYCDSCPSDLKVKAWRWSFWSERIKPTHWMPLPEPPSSSGQLAGLPTSSI
jgi:hypothetical protein